MTCRELDDAIDDLLSDELPPAQRRACEAHLAGCEACRRHLSGYRRTIAVVKEAFAHDGVAAPPDLVDAIVDAAVAASRRKRNALD
jgi:anti-sigma factor RsiW